MGQGRLWQDFYASDKTGWTWSGSSTCKPKVHSFVMFSDGSYLTSIEQRAAILPVEAALEVGSMPTFHHDAEHSMVLYLNHLGPALDDSRWNSEDSSSSSDEEFQATPTLSRTSANVYSAYLWLQQRMQ